MLITKYFKAAFLTVFYCCVCFAETSTQIQNTSTSDPTEVRSQSLFEDIQKVLGITYFSYFNGPGMHPNNLIINPNQLGNPNNDGINFLNQVSFRWKVFGSLALDFQTRFYWLLNNGAQNEDFQVLRWETPRIGVSGKLWSGKDWSLVGAVNTDFPYIFPAPFTGYQAQKRTVLFTPGVFAKLHYEPKNSRWSLIGVVSPRYLLYAERDAAESQLFNEGLSAANKPELILAFQPALNYKLTSATGVAVGTTLDYRKQVGSRWNIFNASLITNGESPAWRLNAVPLALGVTHVFSSRLSIFPYVSAFPIAIQRTNAKTGHQATLLESASFGMWLSGTLF